MSLTPIFSSVTAPPKVVHGFQVLLVESNQDSLQQHVYFLLQNSYRVTSANNMSTGLSMIANGNTFDCVVVDTENFGIDMVQFLHQALKRQPQVPIIVMVGDDLQGLIVKQTLTNEAIWFLQKPCGADQICDLLQQVCTKRINFIERASIINNNISSMINNNFSSSNGGHLDQNVNSQKYGAMSKSQSYVDISSDDDEPGRARGIDKRRKATALKRKNDQSVMDHIYLEKGKGRKPRAAWKQALHEDYPKANQMSVPGLTSEHVGGHLQMGNKLLESYSCQSSGLSIPSNNDASMIQKSSNLLSHLKFNGMGASFYSIDNVKVKVHRAPPSNLPKLNTTTTINYSGGDQVSDCNFGDPCLPLIGDISMSNAVGLAENPENNGTAQGSPSLCLPQRNTTTTINYSGGDQVSNCNFGDPCLPLIGDTSTSNAFGLAENPDNNGTAQGSPSLHLPTQLNTTTTINYSGGDQVSNCSFGDPFQPLIGDISMSNAFGLAENPDNNGTAQGSPSLHLPTQLNTTTTINYSGGDQVSNCSFGDPFQPLIGDISMSNTFGLAENRDNNGTAQGSPSLYLPAQLNTTTTISYSGGDQVSNFTSGDTFQPPIGDISTSNAFGLAENPDNAIAQCIETFLNNHTLEEEIAPPGVNATIEPDYTSGVDFSDCLANVDYGGVGGSGGSKTLAQTDKFGGVGGSGVDATKFSDCLADFDYGGVGGSGVSETLAHTDRFGLAIDSFGGGDEDSSNPDSVSFGHASTGVILPSTVVEDNSNQTEIQHVNSIVPVDGSEGKPIDNEWYMKMVSHKSGNPMENING